LKKMDIVPPTAPVSSVSKGAYDAVFVGNLTSSQVAAFDELFRATNNRVGNKKTCSSRIPELDRVASSGGAQPRRLEHCS